MNENEPEYEPPRVTMAVTDNLEGDKPIAWQIQASHPFVPNMKIMAMFVHSGTLEIYSTDGNKIGIRERIPLNHVRFIREQIPSDSFGYELDISEAKHLGEDEDEDEDGPDDLPPITTNGPSVS